MACLKVWTNLSIMNVLDAIGIHKDSKFMSGELRTIIFYQLIWQVKECQKIGLLASTVVDFIRKISGHLECTSITRKNILP